jgi:uncharacterized membrane protein YgcG
MALSKPQCSRHPGRWSYGRDLCIECESIEQRAAVLRYRQRQVQKQDSFMERYSVRPREDDTSAANLAVAAIEIAIDVASSFTSDFTGGGGSGGGGGADGSW